MKRRTAVALCALVSVISLVGMAATIPAPSGATDSLLSIEVTPEAPETTSSGESFKVTYRVDTNGSAMYAYDIVLDHDPSQLTATSVSEGPFLSDGINQTIDVTTAADAANGTVRVARSRIGNESVSGEGELFSVVYEVSDGADNSDASISMDQSLFLDQNANEIDSTVRAVAVSIEESSATSTSGGGGGGGDLQPDFAVDASVQARTVGTGETISVDLTVENEGIVGGEFEGNISLDGQSIGEGQTIELRAGEVTQTTLEGSTDEAGIYDLRVAGRELGTVTVLADGVEAMAISSVDGDTATFEATALNQMVFSQEVSGEVTVKQLGTPPDEAPEPEGESLTSLDVSVPDGARDTSATIRFGVSQDVFANSQVTPERIALLQFNDATGEWENKETNIADESGELVEFSAGASSFETLAIVVQPEANQTPVETEQADETDDIEGGDDSDTPADEGEPSPGSEEAGGFGPTPVLLVIVLIIGVGAAAYFLRQE